MINSPKNSNCRDEIFTLCWPQKPCFKYPFLESASSELKLALPTAVASIFPILSSVKENTSFLVTTEESLTSHRILW